MKHFLVRCISLILALSLAGTNASSWAADFAIPARNPSQAFFVFSQQAVVEPLDAGFIAGRWDAAWLRMTASHLLFRAHRLIAGVGMAAVLAQAQQPPIVRQQLPQANEIDKQNRILAQGKSGWHLPDTTDPQLLENQLLVVINNNPEIAAKFYVHREEWQKLLAMRADDGKYITNHSDQLHAAGLASAQSTVGQVLSYPGVSASQPKKRIETADFGPVDKTHPGFLHWRTLTHYAMKAIHLALTGVQIYSKDQEEMSFLREHGAAIDVREAYANLEQSVFDNEVAAARAWLAVVVQGQQTAPLHDAAWIAARAEEREKSAVSQEGGTPTDYFRLQRVTMKAEQSLNDKANEREPLRLFWLEHIGHDEKDLSGSARRMLLPSGFPVWPMNRDIFTLTELVRPLIKAEGAADNVEVPPALPLPFPDQWNMDPPTLPEGSFAPASFLPSTTHALEGAEINDKTIAELETLFTPTPEDAPLGTTPRQRFLQLQKESIEDIQMQMLALQKLPSWDVGLHIDLGTMPFIAGLLNWDYRRPERGTVISLGELQTELELRLREIDQDVKADRKNVRAQWLAARADRQKALVQLISIRNQIIQLHRQQSAAHQLLQKSDELVAADEVTPALEIERLKHIYILHLSEAWAAGQVMALYSTEGQERVAAATLAHYSQVMQVIDPTYTATPDQLNPPLIVEPPTSNDATPTQNAPAKKESIFKRFVRKMGKTLGAIIPLALIGFIHLGTATVLSAHTFVAQTASTAVQSALQTATGANTQVVVDVIVGKFTGGAQNTPGGITLNILRALHPKHVGRFSQKQISDVLNHFMEINHIKDAQHMPIGRLHAGTFDADVANTLQGHLSGATAHAASPAPPAASHTALHPADHTQAALQGHGHPVLDSLGSAFHTATHWLFSDPYHALLVVGILLAMIIAVRIIQSPGRRERNGRPYRAFAVAKHISNHNWIAPLRKLWLPLSLLILIPLFGHLNLPTFKLGSSQRESTNNPAVEKVIKKVENPLVGIKNGIKSWMDERRKTLSNSDSLATNYGVSVQPIPLPVSWTAPAGAAGAVDHVHIEKHVLNAGEYGIVLNPLDPALQSRLNTVNEEGQLLDGRTLINPNAITNASLSHSEDAYIYIKPFPETSGDREIESYLDRMHDLFLDIRIARARQAANEEGLGVQAPLPLDAKAKILEVRALGLKIDAALLRRTTYNIPLTRTVHIFPGSSSIAPGTEIAAGGTYQLFTQEISDELFVQLKLPPVDATALSGQLQNDPMHTSIRLRSSDGEDIIIPVTAIDEFVTDTDPTFGSQARIESFFGQQFSNPIVGAAATIPANFIVKGTARKKLDESKRYQFLGVYTGNDRVEQPATTMTVGTFSLNYTTSAQPPHRSMRKPLEQERHANVDMLDKYTALLADARTIQNQFPERSTMIEVIRGYEKTIAQLNTTLRVIDQTLSTIDQSGNSQGAASEIPQDRVRFQYYPLERRFALSVPEENFAVLENRVRGSITFYADGGQLGKADTVYVRTPQGSVPFRITATRSLDRTLPFLLVTAERVMPLSEARTLIPNNLPLTKPAMDEVGLAPFVAGKSQLKGSELFRALIWTLPVVVASNILHLAGANQPLLWILGYVGAFVLHEYIGHGLKAFLKYQGIKTHVRLRWAHGNFEWQSGEGSNWQPILDKAIQRAGPIISQWSAILGFALFFFAFIGHVQVLIFTPILFLAIAIPSAVFRNADQPVMEETALKEALQVGPDTFSTADEQRREQVKSADASHQYMDANELANFKDTLENYVFEYERYWYRGDDTTYLTWKQLFWDVFIRHKDKLALSERKVYLRLRERDNVTNLQAWLLDQRRGLQKGASAAGSKTTTFLWVTAILLAGMLYLLMFAPAETVRSVTLMLKTNPMELVASASTSTVGRVVGWILVIFIGGWVIGGASEFWGKLFATLPYNSKLVVLKILEFIFRPQSAVFERTRRDGLTELDNIYKTNNRILFEQHEDYHKHKRDLDRFASQFADHVFVNLNPKDFKQPSKMARAFTAAFRIQVRRSRGSHAKIYDHPVELEDPQSLMRRLEHRGYNLGAMSDEERYHLLECAQVEEALNLSRQYAMHTLMAALRSGDAELFANIQGMQDRGLIREILEDLKKRTDTLDPDVSSDVRMQERLATFFDLLHYVFEGLRGHTKAIDARYGRRRIFDFLKPSVRSVEVDTWLDFNEKIDALMSTNGKTPEESEVSANVARGIIYTLTERTHKENEMGSREFLTVLRREHPHAPEVILADEYLRNAHGMPATDVLELNMMYQKYLDLLREFTARFPKLRIFGNTDIYITCENTVNFRQTLREAEVLLQLTAGNIIFLNVAQTHPNFARDLRKYMPRRLPWRMSRRLKIKSLESIVLQRRLLRDRNAIILSSASPIEWNSLISSAGLLVQESTPLAKMLILTDLIDVLHHDDLQKYFESWLHSLYVKYQGLHEQSEVLEQKIRSESKQLSADALAQKQKKNVRRSLWGAIGIMWDNVGLAWRQYWLIKSINANDQLIQERIAIRHEARELMRLQTEMSGARYFAQSIHLSMAGFDDLDKMPTNPPLTVGKYPLDGNYRLDVFPYRYPKPEDYKGKHDPYARLRAIAA